MGGASLAELLRTRVTEPLGMHDTGMLPTMGNFRVNLACCAGFVVPAATLSRAAPVYVRKVVLACSARGRSTTAQ